MTYVTCTLCGTKDLKSKMLWSRHTGRSYCIDRSACSHRKIANMLPKRIAS